MNEKKTKTPADGWGVPAIDWKLSDLDWTIPNIDWKLPDLNWKLPKWDTAKETRSRKTGRLSISVKAELRK
jgi:hypothetical protein